jgi:FG-GAP-like repeat
LRIDQNIALGVADAQHFLLSNQSRDRVVEQQGLGGPVDLVQDRSGGILAPGQTRIATVAGVQYAVVANSGANSVLVYPLINGMPDVTRRQTYFVGADPVGITVADVNGDRVPDVVVADYGSNDVTVLLGQAGAAGWSLTPGPRLQTGGIGPVSTAVEDVNGDGLPDILVSNQVSGTVALLPGVGGGFFNDQNPLVRAAGALPGTLLGTGSGVVAVNAGSNDLTFFPDFMASTSFSFASGGLTPEAAVALDRLGGGTIDTLVVANNGDGVLALFVAEGNTFVLKADLNAGDGLHPTDLALAAVQENSIDVYLTAAGLEAVLRFSFEFGVPTPPGSNPPDQAPRPVFVLLVRFDEGGLDVIATVVIGVVADAESFATASSALDSKAAASLEIIAKLLGDPGVDDAGNVALLDAPGASGVHNFIDGTDEGLQRSRRDLQQRLDQPTSPPHRLPQSKLNELGISIPEAFVIASQPEVTPLPEDIIAAAHACSPVQSDGEDAGHDVLPAVDAQAEAFDGELLAWPPQEIESQSWAPARASDLAGSLAQSCVAALIAAGWAEPLDPHSRKIYLRQAAL